MRRAQTRQRITLVDGFCGGGQFTRDGGFVKGTPLLFLDAVEKAERDANVGRTKRLSIDAEYHFVDKKKDHVEYLRSELIKAGHLAKIDQSIFLHHGAFQQVLPSILARIEARTRDQVGRSIFLLDQLGYSDVDFETVRRILRFKAAECIVTYAVGWLIDYLNDSPQTAKRVAPLEISEEQIRDFLMMKDEWGGRYLIQRLLLRHITEKTGARFQSPFFLRSTKARKDLWLVHLSNHLKARNVMVDSHWVINNQSLHQGHGGLELLGFDPSMDPSTAPDFWFGERDLTVLQDKLAEDFLKRIHEQHRGRKVPYLGFVTSIANETPARLSDIDQVTALLVNDRELDLANANDSRKRTTLPTYRDTIAVAREPRLFSYSKNDRGPTDAG